MPTYQVLGSSGRCVYVFERARERNRKSSLYVGGRAGGGSAPRRSKRRAEQANVSKQMNDVQAERPSSLICIV